MFSSNPVMQPECVNLLVIKGDQVERIKQEKPCDENIIEIKSSAEIRCPPDRATVSILVTSSKETAADAKFSVERRVAYILHVLRAHSIKDVETVNQLLRNENNFTMNSQITIQFTDFAECFQIINLFVEKLDRNVTVKGPDFYHSADAMREARKEACVEAGKNAHEKAQELARVFSARVGKLISLNEDKSTCRCVNWEPSPGINFINFKESSNTGLIVFESEISAKFALSIQVTKPLIFH